MPGDGRAVHLGGFEDGTSLIRADAFFLTVVFPVADIQYAAAKMAVQDILSQYAASGSVRAADLSLGMVAGIQGATKAGSQYAACIDGTASGTGHAARGIAARDE